MDPPGDRAGRRPDIGLGGLARVSLADAREEARKLRGIAGKGGDPGAERKAEQGIPAMEQAARDLYDTLKPGWRKGGVPQQVIIDGTRAMPERGDFTILKGAVNPAEVEALSTE